MRTKLMCIRCPSECHQTADGALFAFPLSQLCILLAKKYLNSEPLKMACAPYISDLKRDQIGFVFLAVVT